VHKRFVYVCGLGHQSPTVGWLRTLCVMAILSLLTPQTFPASPHLFHCAIAKQRKVIALDNVCEIWKQCCKLYDHYLS